MPEITPEEFNNFAKYLVRLDNSSIATTGIKRMFEVHPDMHTELGEIKNLKTNKFQEKYLEGLNIFIDKYGEYF